jgi:Prenylcysteine lyase
MIDRFSQLYSLDVRKWDNVSALASSFGWTEIASTSMSSYLESHGISKLFIGEIVDAATRQAYAQVCTLLLLLINQNSNDIEECS